MERRNSGLFKILSLHLTRGTEANHENISEYRPSDERDLNSGSTARRDISAEVV
jgi:hypothetical protein